jgi:23S rRNA pseudouridine2457 synthase
MSMFSYFVVYKPFHVLSQFSAEGDKKTLKDCFDVPRDVYPVGRLDFDSEGLLILTNDTTLNAALLQPKQSLGKTYLVQVEGEVTPEALRNLQKGVGISIEGKKYQTLPAKAIKLNEAPEVGERNPPIRFRKNIPTSWVMLTIHEGKNRQVRKMTAAVGFPTLRLIRFKFGKLTIEGWDVGEIRSFTKKSLLEAIASGE